MPGVAMLRARSDQEASGMSPLAATEIDLMLPSCAVRCINCSEAET